MSRLDNQYVKDLHLSNYAQAEWNKDGYVAQLVLPRVLVGNPMGKITNNGKQGMRIVDTRKGERASYNYLKFDIGSPDSYALSNHGLLDDISTEEMKNWKHAGLLPLRESKIKNLVGAQLNAFEKAVMVDVLSDTSIMTNNISLSGSAMRDVSTSTPIKDIRDEIENVERRTGQTVTKIVLAKDVLNVLADHADFKDKLWTATGRERTMTQKRVIQIVEDEFDIKVVVPKARYYDNTDTPWYFFTKKVALLAVSDTPTLDSRDFGKTFTMNASWPQVFRLPLAGTVEGFEKEMEEMLKVKDSRDAKVLDVDCSFLFNTVIS